MTARLDLERSVSDWLAADASASGSKDVLTAVLDRVATTPQDRHLTQHILGDRLGRQRHVRVALLAGLLAIALVGAAIVVGSQRRTAPQPGPIVNGWIALAADPGAGDDLSGDDLDRGRPRDIYLARPGQPPHRLLATDQISESCPAFSPDGTRLAYVESASSGIPPTPPPVPSGSDGTPIDGSTPIIARGGPLMPLAIAVASIDARGNLTGDIVRIPVQELSSCPEWSPTGDRLAFATSTGTGYSLWAVDLGGRAMLVASDIAVPDDVNASTISAAFDWSPDGSSIAVLDATDVGIIATTDGATRTFSRDGARTVAWSPDGSMLALAFGDKIRVVRPDGSLVGELKTDVGGDVVAFAWSPDSTWIAWSDAEAIRRSTPDGTRLESRAFDLAVLLGVAASDTPTPSIVGSSPDGKQALVTSGAPDVPAGLYAVPWDPAQPAQVVVRPTLAIRGPTGSWQAVP